MRALECGGGTEIRAMDDVEAVENEWGRAPDVLVIYSYSGIVPDDVADYAARAGVRIVKGPRELKRLLDGIAGGSEAS